MRSRLPAAAFWTAFGLNLALAAASYRAMPAVVASHFDAAGRPNSYAPREMLVGIHVFVVLTLGAVILINGAALRTPNARFNLPHKDYWLAPERREETIAWIEGRMRWFGAATFLLLLDVFGQVLRMNLGHSRTLDHAWLSVGAFMAFGLVWTVGLLRRFVSKPG